MKKPEPPVAKTLPHEMEHHGRVRVDEYFWMRERENPEVRRYLEAENAYTETVMAPTEALRQELYEEIKGRIRQTDESVPVKSRDYYYYQRVEEGKDYPFYCRKKGSLEADEEIMLDGNALAEGHAYFSLRGLRVSFGQDLLAYAADTVGRRVYTLRFKNLATGEDLADVIPEVTGNLAWANDNKTVFYSKPDLVTLRPYRIYRHVLGTDPADDVLVFEEEDETFRTGVYRTKSRCYLLIASLHTVSSEYRYLDASDPTGTFRLIEPRQRDHEYEVDHCGDHFYIRTNHEARNFRLMKAPEAAPSLAHWQEVLPYRDEVFTEEFELFRDHLVVAERRDGLVHLRVLPWSGDEEHEITFDESTYLAGIGNNPELESGVLRFTYSSLATPQSVYDYDMTTREKVLMKRDEVLGGFDSANYEVEYLHATASDGMRVPISLIYHRAKAARDGASPLLVNGYGAYGLSRDPTFTPSALSLIDRGFVYAIAHIRGGQELGRQWYDNGRLFAKKNTFTDFIACTEYLVAKKYGDPKRIYARGGSAGGLLLGAVMNLRGDLYHGMNAAVPFVDVVTTMLDDSIPLTTFEYDEWGDPRRLEDFEYILSYSPYDNVEAKDYPHLLVTTGLHDSQVQYWEPAKWVARLRAKKTDTNRLLLKTNLEAGHGGASGRYRRYREIAFEYAFLLDLAGLR